MFLYPPTIPFIFKYLPFVLYRPLALPSSILMMSPEKHRWSDFYLSSFIWLTSGKFSLPCSHGHGLHTHCPPGWRQHTDATQPPPNPPDPNFIMHSPWGCIHRNRWWGYKATDVKLIHCQWACFLIRPLSSGICFSPSRYMQWIQNLQCTASHIGATHSKNSPLVWDRLAHPSWKEKAARSTVAPCKSSAVQTFRSSACGVGVWEERVKEKGQYYKVDPHLKHPLWGSWCILGSRVFAWHAQSSSLIGSLLSIT